MRPGAAKVALVYALGICVFLSGAVLAAHPAVASTEPKLPLADGSPTAAEGLATAEAGEIVWIRQFGTAGGDEALHVAVDASGIYVAGYTHGALPGYTNMGFSDVFVRKYDVDGNELWTRQFGTSGGDGIHAVALDASGIYVVGTTGGGFPGQTYAGRWDIFVRKYSLNGVELWTRQFGSSEDDFPKGIALDASGVYVAGYTFGALPGQTSAGTADVFIRKYGVDGTELWTRQFGSSDRDITSGIALDASGVYVAGHTFGALPGQRSAGGLDVFVRKYGVDGTELWTRQFGTPKADHANSVTVEASGVYIAGDTSGTFRGERSAGGQDVFVRKYDPNGNELWTRQFGSSDFDYPKARTLDASGIYVAGETWGALPGQTSAGNLDVFVRKYGVDGSELWTRQFGSPDFDGPSGIALDASGVYVAGGIGGDVWGTVGDVFVRKYDVDGNELWTRQFGSAASDSTHAIALDASDVYVAGDTWGALPGQTNAGGFDAFVAKLAIPNAAPTPPTLGAMGVYIFDDATGGDCYLIGTWSDSTKTCTLTQDVSETIVIGSDGITLDGGGHSIIYGSGSVGVYAWSRSGLTVRNTVVSRFPYGIILDYSRGNTISGNTVSGRDYGIQLIFSTSNTVSGNTISGGLYGGIALYRSRGNTISGNTVSDSDYGIQLIFSTSNSVSGNTVSDSRYGIFLDYSRNNTVSGNTIPGSGRHGIDLGYSTNNTVSGNTVSHTGYGFPAEGSGNHGIYLYSSSDNTISGNTVLDSAYGGIVLETSRGNTVTGNTVSDSRYSGIGLNFWSRGNTISGNTVSRSGYGLDLWYSSGNTISGNTVLDSGYGIYLSRFRGNTVSGNTVSRSLYGIFVDLSSSNTIFHNSFIDNTYQLYIYSFTNTWNNPANEGNYWSDYVGLDDGSGGRVAGDGIGDTNLPHLGVDWYPLMSIPAEPNSVAGGELCTESPC